MTQNKNIYHNAPTFKLIDYCKKVVLDKYMKEIYPLIMTFQLPLNAQTESFRRTKVALKRKQENLRAVM